MALGLTVWRKVLVQEAQTKGVREVDMAAVYGWLDYCMSPADGQKVEQHEVGLALPFAAEAWHLRRVQR